jgi:hypothetical protein
VKNERLKAHYLALSRLQFGDASFETRLRRSSG